MRRRGKSFALLKIRISSTLIHITDTHTNSKLLIEQLRFIIELKVSDEK